MTLFTKETLENWRNFKWIWVPLVLILLAIMDPLTMYYMPVLLDSVGGLPEGSVLEMPTPSTTEVFMMTIGQLNSLGVVVIVLMAMGTIANERKSGVLELTLVKPVSFVHYITAKWTSLVLLVSTSLFVALLASWYYTNLLFGSVAFTTLLLVYAFFVIWFIFITGLIILYNTFTRSAGVVAALTIGTIVLLSTGTSLFTTYLPWSPAQIPTYIQEMLITSAVSFDLIMTLGITIIATLACLWISVICIERKEIS